MSENFNPYQSPASNFPQTDKPSAEHAVTEHSNEFAVVARCFTPTEAHLLKGALVAGGVRAEVADDNLVQANSWLATAVGGVRVLVPVSQLDDAREIIASLEKGEFQLEGEDASSQQPNFTELKSPVYSPEAAAVWSIVLTPMFGAVLHLANARVLGDIRLCRIAWSWTVALAIITLAGLYAAFNMAMTASAPFRASLILSFVTLVWYFLAGQAQSRHLLNAHGARYPRKGMFMPALIVGFGWFVLAWLISEFA